MLIEGDPHPQTDTDIVDGAIHDVRREPYCVILVQCDDCDNVRGRH
jgi:hypothetical protein